MFRVGSIETSALAAAARCLARCTPTAVGRAAVGPAVTAYDSVSARRLLPVVGWSRQYHNRKDPLHGIMNTAVKKYVVVDDVSTAFEDFIVSLRSEYIGRIGPQVITQDSRSMQPRLHDPYNPALTKAFPRFKLVEGDDVRRTMMAAQEYIRKRFNANETLHKPKQKEQPRVLGKDTLCGSKGTNYVFTDTSKGYTKDSRRIFVRESDGTLRTANEEERDRMNQQYFSSKHQPLHLPGLFTSPEALSEALRMNQHPSILDIICKLRSHDSRDYIKVHRKVYEDVNERRVFSILQDTPHFYGFVRWLIAENEIEPLLTLLLQDDRVRESQNLAKLYILLKPTSNAAVEYQRQQDKIAAETTADVTADAAASPSSSGKPAPIGVDYLKACVYSTSSVVLAQSLTLAIKNVEAAESKRGRVLSDLTEMKLRQSAQ